MAARITSARSAFTLTELVIAIAVSTVLVGGLLSAVAIATKAATPGIASGVRESHAVLDQIASELANAIEIRSRTDRAISFVVPDRNNDGTGETLAYSWTGIAGSPLTRSINASTPVNVLDAIHEFRLSFSLTAKSVETPGTGAESLATTLISNTATSNAATTSITATQWCGQYFRPVLPANAMGWRLSKLRFAAASDGASNGVTRVEIRSAADGDIPGSTVLTETTLLESALKGSIGWVEHTYTGMPLMNPNSGLCVVFRHQSDAVSCKVQHINGTYLTHGKFLVTTDGGLSWTASHTGMLSIVVIASTVAPGATSATTQYEVASVHMSLSAESATAANVDTVVFPMNRLGVSGP